VCVDGGGKGVDAGVWGYGMGEVQREIETDTHVYVYIKHKYIQNKYLFHTHTHTYARMHARTHNPTRTEALDPQILLIGLVVPHARMSVGGKNVDAVD
jgi:hypothetical protein